jgi:multidrug efflux system membrane fusion protein
LSKWFWGLCIIFLCALAWYFFHKSAATGANGSTGWPGTAGSGRNATSVGIATVETADIPITLNALGTVTATATAIVRSQVSGVLQQINFQEGEMVKAGQLLATIDPRPFELTLMQASGQRQRDEAQLVNERIVLARDKVLQAQDSIAQQDVEAQETLVKQLEGTVMSDRAQEGSARLNLSYTKVVAPVSGRVGLRTVDIGNLVSTNDATGIATITQIAPIDVVFAVPQNQVGDVQAGLKNSRESSSDEHKPATLHVMVLDRNRTDIIARGEFLALDNQVDIQTGTVKAKARFTNEQQQLFPNEFVNVKVILRHISGAIVVPVAALRHGSKGDFVYVLDVETKTVSQRKVTAGPADIDKVQIIDGLVAGEKVITEGADRLKDGAKVNLPSSSPADAKAGIGGEQKPNWKVRDGKSRDEKNPDWKSKKKKDAATESSAQSNSQPADASVK